MGLDGRSWNGSAAIISHRSIMWFSLPAEHGPAPAAQFRYGRGGLVQLMALAKADCRSGLQTGRGHLECLLISRPIPSERRLALRRDTWPALLRERVGAVLASDQPWLGVLEAAAQNTQRSYPVAEVFGSRRHPIDRARGREEIEGGARCHAGSYGKDGERARPVPGIGWPRSRRPTARSICSSLS